MIKIFICEDVVLKGSRAWTVVVRIFEDAEKLIFCILVS